MRLVGIRELKKKLTHYLETAREGEAIIITDRGVPVAILHGLDRVEEGAGRDERLAYLAGQGFLTLPKKGPERGFPRIERAEVKGGSVSDTIVRERR